MKKTWIIFILLLIFSINKILAQEFNLTEIKKLNKDSIIQLAFNQLNKKDINIPKVDTSRIKVMVNSKSLYVQFNMGFKKVIADSVFENYDIKIFFYKNSTVVIPQEINLKLPCYNLFTKERKQLDFVLKGFPNAYNEEARIRIVIKNDGYELTFSRGASLGSECFFINKKTGEKSLKWHEHPMREQSDITKNEDLYIEIK